MFTVLEVFATIWELAVARAFARAINQDAVDRRCWLVASGERAATCSITLRRDGPMTVSLSTGWVTLVARWT
ncbi:MAG: hypothetical protein CMJ44_18295, partial [Pimelobacter sp.]|nr:hypothetical protein [Pimelobacter sp.]